MPNPADPKAIDISPEAVAQATPYAEGLRGFADFIRTCARGDGLEKADHKMVAYKFEVAAKIYESLAAERDDLRSKLAEAERERDEAKNQYRCYSCKQVFNEDGGHGLAAEHFGSALRDPLPKCCEIIDGTARWGGGPHDPFLRVLKTHYDEITSERDAALFGLAKLRERTTKLSIDYTVALDEKGKALDELAKLRAEAEWRPIETMPKGEEIFMAATAHGRFLIVRGSILANMMKRSTPDHLQFPAVAWKPLPPPKDPAHD